MPRFQRGYSWEKKHVEQFWNDIATFQKESGAKGGPDKYFLGPIVIMPDPSTKDFIYLLDGQQRLATATILLSVLRDVGYDLKITDAEVFAKDLQAHFITKEDIGYSLELGELDKTYFTETVQNDPPAPRKAALRSHRNIQKAHEVLEKAVREHIGGANEVEALAKLKRLRRILKSELIMACIPVTSERDAFRIFETLNDRGLRLSVPDLLLNFLMRIADSNDADAKRSQIRDFWNEMLEGMGRQDINRFLRHMWVSKYGDLKGQDLFSALKTHIEEKKVDPVDFARSCSEECARYVELWKANEEHLGGAAPYIRTLVRDLGFEAALPLLMASYPVFHPTDLKTIVQWLLVFVTRYSIVVGLDPSGLETTFFRLAREIRERMPNADANAKPCLTHIKETLVKQAPSDDQVKASVGDLSLYPGEASYLLSRIATRMQTETKEVKIDESNLEHVFPKKPSAEWEHPEELEPFLWHLGNLTMLGQRLNDAVENKGYPAKRAYYQSTSELVMAQNLAKTYDVWNEETIRDRAKKLAPYITEVWNFNNPSRV